MSIRLNHTPPVTPLFEGVQHALRPDRRFYPRPTVVDRSCLCSLWHSRRVCVRRSAHHASTSLRPFAPRKLLRFDATMDALTPVRLAPCRRGLGQCLPWCPPFRAAWQMGTRPCPNDRPSTLDPDRSHGFMYLALCRRSVSNHQRCPVIALVLSCSRDRLPPLPLAETARFSGFASQLQARRHHPAESSSLTYGPSVHFRLLPTSPPGDAVTFSYKSENLDLEGTFAPRTWYTHHRTVGGHVAANFPKADQADPFPDSLSA